MQPEQQIYNLLFKLFQTLKVRYMLDRMSL